MEEMLQTLARQLGGQDRSQRAARSGAAAIVHRQGLLIASMAPGLEFCRAVAKTVSGIATRRRLRTRRNFKRKPRSKSAIHRAGVRQDSVGHWPAKSNDRRTPRRNQGRNSPADPRIFQPDASRQPARRRPEPRRKFVPGRSAVPYAGRVFNEDEVAAAVSSTLDFWLTLGKEGEAFEKGLARFLGVKKSVLVQLRFLGQFAGRLGADQPQAGRPPPQARRRNHHRGRRFSDHRRANFAKRIRAGFH